MILNLIFKCLPLKLQISFLKNRGILVGSRIKDERYIYLYMFQDLFAEILYRNDDTDQAVEGIMIFSNLQKFNSYLENDFRKNVRSK